MIPADYINGNVSGFERQAFLGFKLWSNNGVVKYDVHISDIKNGEVNNVSFDEGKKSVREYGDVFILSPYVIGNNGDRLSTEFLYKSGDESVATVDANGIVRVVGYGTVAISATSLLENKSATHTISVDVPIFEFAKEEFTLTVGKDGILPVVTGAKASVPITVKSSDPFGLVALSGGVVQGVKVGVYTVTATYLGYTAECVVRVVEADGQENASQSGSGGNAKSGCGGSIGTGEYAAIVAACVTCVAIVFSVRRKKDAARRS